MKRPMGYRTKRCKHNNKLRVWFRTVHRIRLEFEWPPCCDPKQSGGRGRGKGVPPSEAKEDPEDSNPNYIDPDKDDYPND